jgi:ribonuclease VapC
MTLHRPAPADLVVDTSAVVSILLDEPAKNRLAQFIAAARGPMMSAGSLLEVLIVTDERAGAAGVAEAQRVVDAAGIVVMPVDGPTAREAHLAWQRFGKGNHPAALNYGDCFTYALAARTELPVLCVGDDFARTDLDVIQI